LVLRDVAMIEHRCVDVIPPIHTYRIVRRNSKYQPFLQMSELTVRCCGTVGSSTAWFK